MQEFSKYRIITVGFILMFIFIVAAIYTNTRDIANKKLKSSDTMQEQIQQPITELGTQTAEFGNSDFVTQNDDKNISNNEETNNKIMQITERIDELERKVFAPANDNDKSVRCMVQGIIDDGHIATWKYDEDGDFYHSPDQWEHNGWLRPFHTDNYLIFGIITPKNETMSKLTYAVYHGRFVEMLLNHFDRDSDWIYTSTQATKYDIL